MSTGMERNHKSKLCISATSVMWHMLIGYVKRQEELICEIYNALGISLLQAFIGSSLLGQCRQLAFITSQIENDLFVYAIEASIGLSV